MLPLTPNQSKQQSKKSKIKKNQKNVRVHEQAGEGGTECAAGAQQPPRKQRDAARRWSLSRGPEEVGEHVVGMTLA
jgi:hypothetical protein